MNKIRLPRDGAEYAHFTFSDEVPLDAVLEAQVGAGAWAALDRSVPVPRLLLRGPDAATVDGVLVSVDSPIRVRIKDSPEIIVRGAGSVVLVSAS